MSDNRTLRERITALEVLVENRFDNLDLQFTNHLHTHAKYTYLAFTTLLGVVVTLVLMLIKLG